MFSLLDDETEDIKERFPDGECYKFVKDGKNIGLAVINKDENDKVFIFIKKELRGNGYGKKLFSELKKELVKRDYKDIKVKFDKENIQILKIIEDNGGLHLSTDKDTVKYLVPISCKN